MKVMCVCLLGFLLSVLPYATYAAVRTTPPVEAGLSPQALQGIKALAKLAMLHPELATQSAGGCATRCEPESSDTIRGIYFPITQQSLVSLAMLAVQNSSLSVQRAGDCQTSCEWDPIAKEQVCSTHCDPDQSAPPDNGPPPKPVSQWTADDWVGFFVVLGLVVLILVYLNAAANQPVPGYQ